MELPKLIDLDTDNGVASKNCWRYPRRCDMGGITHTRVDPQLHIPYVIFRNMSPHFDSYANSGIPDITGTEYQLHRWDDDRRCQLLHLLPHLQLIDVGTCMEHRIETYRR